MTDYLNLGCGSRFHPAWTNVNFTQTGKGVLAADLGAGIPFGDCSFDLVYHSHLLEHFSKAAAPDFLRHCYRVLRPGGVIRVVVPDLESIARTYISALDQARAGSAEWADNYEWLLLEMYDQVARSAPGGEMAAYLSRGRLSNEAFVVARAGLEARKLVELARQRTTSPVDSASGKQGSFWLSTFRRLVPGPRRTREAIFRLVLGDEYAALELGRFRKSGEVHQWMYDSYSLGKLLSDCGFVKVVTRSPHQSYIPDWARYNLDTEPDGSIYKPDSLFMEGIKP